jgi:hypothetical protein
MITQCTRCGKTIDDEADGPHGCFVNHGVTIGSADYSKTNYLERIAIALEEIVKLLKDG